MIPETNVTKFLTDLMRNLPPLKRMSSYSSSYEFKVDPILVNPKTEFKIDPILKSTKHKFVPGGYILK